MPIRTSKLFLNYPLFSSCGVNYIIILNKITYVSCAPAIIYTEYPTSIFAFRFIYKSAFTH